MKSWLQAALYLSLIILIAITSYTVDEVGRTAQRIQKSIEKLEPQINETVSQMKQMAFELKGAAMAQRQEWESPDYVKARKAWLNAGYQLNAILAHADDDLVPSLTDSSRKLAELFKNTDESLNKTLTPKIGLILDNTDTSIREINLKTQKLADAGILTMQEASEFMKQANLLLEDPAVRTVMTNLAATSEEVRQSASHINQSTASIQETLAYAPKVAADIKAFTAEQKKWNKVVLLTRILRYLF